MKYQSLAIAQPESLIFGTAPHPLATRSGMVIAKHLAVADREKFLPAAYGF